MGEAARQALTTPARGRLRRAAAVITGGLLLAVVVQAPPSYANPAPADAPAATRTAPAAPAAPARPGTGSETAALSLTTLTPTAPAEDDTLTITGTVTNRGKATITGSHVGVRVGLGGQSLSSRSDLGAVSKRTAYVPSDGVEVPKHQVELPDIPSGVSRPFTLKVPVKDLELGGNGVYQLGVSLSGETQSAPFPQILGIERTFLPWYPDPGKTEHTQLAMAWPLIGRTHMDANTESDDQQTAIFRDDELTAELAPGGRLQQLVAIGKDLPVTWIIDPDLLATVDAMAKGYRVANDTGAVDTGTNGPGTGNVGTGTGTDAENAAADETPADEPGADGTGEDEDTRPGTGTDVAKSWLNELKAAVRDSPVVALPFGDPDLASIAHQGKNVPGTLEHLKSATELAALTTDTVLGVVPRTDVAWPAEGAVDTSIVNVARAGGADKVIASSSSLGSERLNHTPNAVRPVGGGTTAIVADDTLSRAFSGDLSRAGSATLAVQNFLAHSLMITMESPNRERSILVAPQRRPSASAAQAMGEALSAAQGGKWISPVGLGTVESAKPEAGADRTVPGQRSYPERLRKQELTASAFRQIQETQTALEGFVVILSEDERVITPLGNAILRSMSDSWREDPAGAEAYRSSVDRYLADLKGLVHIVEKSLSTLSGSSGTLQVTVENNLTQQVTLKLHLTSELPYRFKIDDDQNEQTVTIDGERKKTLQFPTTATTSGKVKVTAQLYAPDGTLYGQPMPFQVNVTSATGAVIAVIACGMLLLVLAGARMYRQRGRAALLAEQDDAEDSGKDDGDGDAENDGDTDADDGIAADAEDSGEAEAEPSGRPTWQPGDPEPDTAVESTVPDTADEKVER